ncbi:TRAP transporter small permease [Rhizobium sullae]|uniref:TRAP transporter small permease protein n=1 Tax=Rhizobium sullae TaxID=50338 RepID=A0A4R3PQC8_RHISU|nr:TRAP transporter small permease [Rhizobium sullae]TCU03649.1 TRAP-type C4-dicarboxylate transport system permease small subunit [Rhizobium sullae]
MAGLDHKAGGQAWPVSASPALRTYQRGVTLICNAAFSVATMLVLVDFCLLGISVVARYLANTPITWADELVALSLTAITVLAAPQVLLDKGHIEVDIVTELAKGRLSFLIRLWSSLAVCLTAMLLIFNGWSLAMFSRMIGLLTEGHLELPLWMLQLLMPLGGFLLLPVVILQFWQAVFACNHPETEAVHEPAVLD